MSIYVILRINYTTDVSTSDSSQNNFFSNLIIAGTSNAVLGAIFYSLWGGNLGHKIMGLIVISSVDGKIKKDATAGAIREGIKAIFSYFLIPSIWLLWDDDNQNLYDKIVKTYVVKNKT